MLFDLSICKTWFKARSQIDILIEWKFVPVYHNSLVVNEWLLLWLLLFDVKLTINKLVREVDKILCKPINRRILFNSHFGHAYCVTSVVSKLPQIGLCHKAFCPRCCLLDWIFYLFLICHLMGEVRWFFKVVESLIVVVSLHSFCTRPLRMNMDDRWSWNKKRK